MQSAQLKFRPCVLVYLAFAFNAGTSLLLWPIIPMLLTHPMLLLGVMLILYFAWSHKDSWPVAVLFLPLTLATWAWIGWRIWNFRVD
jgi:hypothetical protein